MASSTKFEEVSLNFSNTRECLRIKLLSFRTQSDSDLDSDVHTATTKQQSHIKYVCDQYINPQMCQEHGNCESHADSSIEVPPSSVECSQADDVAKEEFADLTKVHLLKQVISKQADNPSNAETNHPMATSESHTDSSTVDALVSEPTGIENGVEATEIHRNRQCASRGPISADNTDSLSMTGGSSRTAEDIRFPDKATSSRPCHSEDEANTSGSTEDGKGTPVQSARQEAPLGVGGKQTGNGDEKEETQRGIGEEKEETQRGIGEEKEEAQRGIGEEKEEAQRGIGEEKEEARGGRNDAKEEAQISSKDDKEGAPADGNFKKEAQSDSDDGKEAKACTANEKREAPAGGKDEKEDQAERGGNIEQGKTGAEAPKETTTQPGDRKVGTEKIQLTSEEEKEEEETRSDKDELEEAMGCQPKSEKYNDELMKAFRALFKTSSMPDLYVEFESDDSDENGSESESHLSEVEEEVEEDGSVGSTPIEDAKECQICLDLEFFTPQSCCQLHICDSCLHNYLNTKISEGLVLHIQCPNNNCNRQLGDYEIVQFLDHETKLKYHKFLVDAQNDATRKTCPRCGQEQRMDKEELAKKKKKKTAKMGIPVTCQTCALRWCFSCHAPWHEGVTCKEYRKGDRLFREWTREREVLAPQRHQTNAQKCPTCKVYIQRSDGCPHMTCLRCSTEFCYDCGHLFFPRSSSPRLFHTRGFEFLFGTHGSRLAPLGCPGAFLPKSPVARKLIRGTVFGVKLVGGVCILVIGAGVVVVGAVFAPVVWTVLKVKRKIRERRLRRNRNSREARALP